MSSDSAAANLEAALIAGVDEPTLRARMEAESARLCATDAGRRDHEHLTFRGTILTSTFVPHLRKKDRDAADAWCITDYCRCAVRSERDVMAALEQTRPAIPSTVLRPSCCSTAASSSSSSTLGALYLGGFGAGRNVKWLRAHGVRAVVNCAREMSLFADHEKRRAKLARGKRGATVLDLGWEDSLSQRLKAAAVQGAIRYIHAARLQGHAVLVHCAAGRSRSASLVVAYLVATAATAATSSGLVGGRLGLAGEDEGEGEGGSSASASASGSALAVEELDSVEKALAFVQSRRLIAKPNVYFLQQLLALEAAGELLLVRQL